MPVNDGSGAEDDKGRLPFRPSAPQSGPEESVGQADRRLGSGPLIHGQLLTKGEVLEDQRSMPAREEGEHVDGADEPGDHGSG